MTVGDAIRETGTLLREGGGFILQRDSGGVYQLELHRVPVDEVAKRVRITGTLVTNDRVDVDGVARI